MQNQIVDALVTMASMMDGPKEDEARSIVLEQNKEPAYYMTIEEDKITRKVNGIQTSYNISRMGPTRSLQTRMIS